MATKISEMDPTEAGEFLYNAFMRAHEACLDGTSDDPHPSKSVSKWRAAAATGEDESNLGLGPAYIQNKKKAAEGEDAPPEFPGKPANPTPSKPAQDSVAVGKQGQHALDAYNSDLASARHQPTDDLRMHAEDKAREKYMRRLESIPGGEALVELAIRQSGSATMDSDLEAARARRSNPARVKAMAAAIPSYGRLR
jgi:hypothetical protein